MKKFIITSIWLCLTIFTIKGQINLRPGYIITNLNDTIQGMIDFRTAERNARICSFRPDSSENIKNYLPGEIYAYRFTGDGKFYVTRQVTIDKTPTLLFLEYIIKGSVSLYYYRSTKCDYYFFEDEEGHMFKMSNETKEVEIEGRHKIMYDPRYVGIMTWLFKKSEKTKKKLKFLRINRDFLSRITKQYHYETCQTGEDCIEFETKPDKHFVKVKYNIGIGWQFHKLYLKDANILWNIDNMKSMAPSLTAGIDLSIPRLTQMIGLNLEGELSGVKGEKDNFSKMNIYNKFHINAFTTDIRTGLVIKLNQISVCPHIEGGLCNTFLWGINDYHSYSYFLFPDGIQQDKKDNSNAIYHNYIGYYVNAGIQIPIEKGAFTLKAIYEQRKHITDKITTWGINVGYIF